MRRNRRRRKRADEILKERIGQTVAPTVNRIILEQFHENKRAQKNGRIDGGAASRRIKREQKIGSKRDVELAELS